MNGYGLARIFLAGLVLLALAACGESPIDVKALEKGPKKYVGSDTCKLCHLEHYDSWKMTLHSRMLQNAQKNRDAIVAPLDEKVIRADLAKAKAQNTGRSGLHPQRGRYQVYHRQPVETAIPGGKGWETIHSTHRVQY